MSKWGAVRLAVALLAGVAGARAGAAVAHEGEARAVLRAALSDEHRWVRVHAAEVLLEFGERASVAEAFVREEARHGSEAGYRVGVWRVLAQARPAERAAWHGRVLAVFCDEAAADRLFAAETLAKLGDPLSVDARAALRRWAAKAPPAERVLLNWLEWQGGDAGARGRLVEALGEADAVARLRAAFVLRFTGTKEPAALAALGGRRIVRWRAPPAGRSWWARRMHWARARSGCRCGGKFWRRRRGAGLPRKLTKHCKRYAAARVGRSWSRCGRCWSTRTATYGSPRRG